MSVTIAPTHADSSRSRPLAGFTPLLRKELKQILRTWRLYVVPGIVVLFAITGPILAKLTKELLASVGGAEMAEAFPDPTYIDAWTQWDQNLVQLVALAMIITTGSAVSGERRSGTAILVFTKPVSRAAFVLAKFCADAVLVIVSSLVGALITWGVTASLFSDPDVGALFGLTAVWLVFALMMIAIVLVFSSVFSSGAAASGLGLAVYIVVSLLGLWGPAAKYSPAGLGTAMGSLAMGEEANVMWPVLTAIVVTVIALVLAVVAVKKVDV